MARRRSSGFNRVDPRRFTRRLDPLHIVRQYSRPLSSLSPIEDLRRYDPANYVNARSLYRAFHSLVVGPTPNTNVNRRRQFRKPFDAVSYYDATDYNKHAKRIDSVPVRVAFKDPKQVVTCIRRKQRREVIFAENKAGAGAKAKTRNRNWRSDISCK